MNSQKQLSLWITLTFFVCVNSIFAQTSPLTIDQIMQGNSFVGTPPRFSHWAPDSKSFFFYANKDNTGMDSLYRFDIKKKSVSANFEQVPSSYTFNKKRDFYLSERNGDIFLTEIKKDRTIQITNSTDYEKDPHFSIDETMVMFQRENNLFGWDIKTGTTMQFTNFVTGNKPQKSKGKDKQDEWLQSDQMGMMIVLNERAKIKKERVGENAKHTVDRPKKIYLQGNYVSNIRRSADGNYITYQLYKPGKKKSTLVPNYVTETSYTVDIKARPNVGTGYGTTTIGCYDVANDTCAVFTPAKLEGLFDNPKYFAEYERPEISETERDLQAYRCSWSPNGKNAVAFVKAKDNKDTWVVKLNFETFEYEQIDRQHDDAWVAGPGITRTLFWLPDNESIVYQSEQTGFSHLYVHNTVSAEKVALTKGKYEIYEPFLSNDGQSVFYTSNQEDSGIRNAYKMDLNTQKVSQLTNGVGRSDFFLAPNETTSALLYSESNVPTELYVALKDKEKIQITHSTTKEFENYQWRRPEIVQIRTEDGEKAKARLYKPDNANGKAVVFVHGAGYLQNAHQWWSSYFREYMFHNFLTDLGYTVIDIDYRGSAGYGRNWRTGIYRHMGGKDLSDQVDGANYLVKEHGIDAKKIGIYGGSYGGFMTLMALMNTDTFAAGAALRSVTDWAHYNHGYTSNILNTPTLDPTAYKRSSPIYFAEGLNEPLLICHGMVDDNVHFQDVVRLSQRFIELRKENWEMAVFPMEPHGFKEATSWADEYKRIFKLFSENL